MEASGRLSDERKKKCHELKKNLLLKKYVATIANIILCVRMLVCVLVCIGGSVVTCTMKQGRVDQSSCLTKKEN
jgi:butyrate kinase